jgi:phosphohistidine phosphatase SixA
VLVLGHNPGMEEAVEELSGRSEAMKTANAALLECDLDNDDWSLALTERWHLVEVVRPKALRADDD